MTNLTEVANFDEYVYEIQTSDPVLGGPGGIANAQAQALADRTQWLKAQVFAIEAELAAGVNAPTYVNGAQTLLGGGVFLVDTEAGGFTIDLPPTPAKGIACVFMDASSTWGVNNWTLGQNGSTIMGRSSDLIVNLSDQEFTIWYNGTTWELR